jgi:hypothetical protein
MIVDAILQMSPNRIAFHFSNHEQSQKTGGWALRPIPVNHFYPS